MSFVKIDKITKTFGTFKALDNVSFDIPKASIFGLLGPNGAGKTTLIRIINRIFLPDEGQVLIDDKLLTSDFLKQIGYLPEERGLYKKMKVGEQLIFFGQLKGLSSLQAAENAKFWLKRLEAISWWSKPVEELSKGMAQKIQFIATVIHNPSLIIFDEPFSGFDPLNVDLISEQIKFLNQQGATIIFSAHNMASVEQLCDSIVLINKGQIILEGKIDEIKNHFAQDSYLISFFDEVNEESIRKFNLIPLDNNSKSFRVILRNKDEVYNFLSAVSKQFYINNFSREIPTLHDIFVQQVKKFNQQIPEYEQNFNNN